MSVEQGKRRSVRLRDHDYRSSGAYFIIICTHDRRRSLGEVVDGAVILSADGKIVEQCWLRLPKLFPWVELDKYVVMPNHLHGIIIGTGNASDSVAVASPDAPAHGTVPGSVGAVIQSFKSISARRVNLIRKRRGDQNPLWQQNYYEHVIRNDKSLSEVRDYIDANPYNWDYDEYRG